MPGLPWSVADVVLIKKLWAAGFTSNQIAARLEGRYTRGAVVGKIHRLGLSKDAATKAARVRNGGAVGHGSGARAGRATQRMQRRSTAGEARAARTPTGKLAVAAAVGEAVADRDQDLLARAKPLRDLEAGECKWPLGDPLTPQFGFCAGPRVPGLPYCERHAMRAYEDPPAVLHRAAVNAAKSEVRAKPARERATA